MYGLSYKIIIKKFYLHANENSQLAEKKEFLG